MGWEAFELAAASCELSDPGRMIRLAAQFDGAAELARAPVKEVAHALGLTVERAMALRRAVGAAAPELLRELGRRGLSVITDAHVLYPALLAKTPHAPPLLWARGDVSSVGRRAVAVVGARKATSYGVSVAEAVAEELTGAGYVVVSGGALGIDAAAHRGALRMGATVAVLACGVDVAYPAVHRSLLSRIAEAGCLLSEFPPGTGARKHHFPQRNRLMAGMCERVVVVEAGLRSGALITADWAADYGRELLAVPGSIWAAQSAGCLRLLSEGAAPLTEPRDAVGADPPAQEPTDDTGHVWPVGAVARAVAGPGPGAGPGVGRAAGPGVRPGVGRAVGRAAGPGLELGVEEELVLGLIERGERSLDALPAAAGLPAARCAAAVTALELLGLVRRELGGDLIPCARLP